MMIFKRLLLILGVIWGTTFNVFPASITKFTFVSDLEKDVQLEFRERFEKEFSDVFSEKFRMFFSQSMIRDLKVEVVVTNEYQRDIIAKNENEKSILFVSPLMIYSNDLKRLLIHEVFHLLHFKIKKEESFISEGIANFLPYYILGKINPLEVNLSLSQSTVSLVDNFSLGSSENELYGVTTLFIKYAFDHCGQEIFLKNLIHDEMTGEKAIDMALKHAGDKKLICKSFSKLAEAFTKARVVNKRAFTQSEELFLIDSKYEIPVNYFIADKLSSFVKKDSLSFIKQIPRFLPILLPLEMKDWLVWAQKIDNDLKFYEISRKYPAFAVEHTTDDGPSYRKGEFYLLIKK